MKHLKHVLLSRFEGLSDREKILITVTSVFLGLFLFYAFVWSPLSQAVETTNAEVVMMRSSLVYAEKALVEVAHYRQKGVQVKAHATSQDALLTLVESGLKASQLSQYLKQVSQPATNEVVLNFDRVPWDLLMTWLQKNAEEEGIAIVSVQADKLPVAGMAKVQLVLRR